MSRPVLDLASLLASLLAPLLVVGALLGGCDKPTYPKDDAQAAAYAKAEADCRAQVRSQAQTQRTIEDQRRATFGGEFDRIAQQIDQHLLHAPCVNTQQRDGWVDR